MTNVQPDSRRLHQTIALGCLLALIACGDTARLTPDAGMGPSPQLPSPRKSLIPTVHVAKAVGWPSGVTPDAAPGLRVNAFATGLDHPRWVYPLPNGDAVITYVMKLDHIKPDEAVRTFTQIVGQLGAFGSIAAVPNAASVIITENTSLIRKLIDI